MTIRATLIPGDGIGPEVTGATCEVLAAAGAPVGGAAAVRAQGAVEDEGAGAAVELDRAAAGPVAASSVQTSITVPTSSGVGPTTMPIRIETSSSAPSDASTAATRAGDKALTSPPLRSPCARSGSSRAARAGGPGPRRP